MSEELNTNIEPAEEVTPTAESYAVTQEYLQKVFPKQYKDRITEELINKINSLSKDPEEAKNFRDNLISFSSVLEEPRIQIKDYINAVIYISHKLRGLSNHKAYMRTFPDRYQDMLTAGYDYDKISGFVAAYNKNKLVNAVREQSLVPTWILNADIYQEAINTQYELMREAKSERVRMMAADSILNHLKRPEAATKADITIDVNTSGLDDLRKSLVKLAEEQKALIQQGTVTTKQVAELDIIDAEVVENNP